MAVRRAADAGHVSLPLQLLKQCHSVDMTCASAVRPGADYAWSAIVWMKNDIADPPAEEDGERRHVETSIALVRCAPLDKTQDAWYCCALKTAWKAPVDGSRKWRAANAAGAEEGLRRTASVMMTASLSDELASDTVGLQGAERGCDIVAGWPCVVHDPPQSRQGRRARRHGRWLHPR